jgi:hypothetical protein
MSGTNAKKSISKKAAIVLAPQRIEVETSNFGQQAESFFISMA